MTYPLTALSRRGAVFVSRQPRVRETATTRRRALSAPLRRSGHTGRTEDEIGRRISGRPGSPSGVGRRNSATPTRSGRFFFSVRRRPKKGLQLFLRLGLTEQVLDDDDDRLRRPRRPGKPWRPGSCPGQPLGVVLVHLASRGVDGEPQSAERGPGAVIGGGLRGSAASRTTPRSAFERDFRPELLARGRGQVAADGGDTRDRRRGAGPEPPGEFGHDGVGFFLSRRVSTRRVRASRPMARNAGDGSAREAEVAILRPAPGRA